MVLIRMYTRVREMLLTVYVRDVNTLMEVKNAVWLVKSVNVVV